MFIDTHAHIYMDKFEEDIDDIIKRSLDAKVNQILLPNIDVNSMESVFSLSRAYPNICKPMVGLHPCSVGASWKTVLNTLSSSLSEENIVAVGEIGVDLYWDTTFKKEQEDAFRYQIEWAKELDLPIVIHSRAAIDRTISIVTEMQDGRLKGIFHCFDQNLEAAKSIIDVGFLMGIGGVLTYKRNHELREVVKNIDLSHIVLETDAPFLPPVPFRGKRNESSYIPLIAERLAELHNTTIEHVAKTTSENAIALFSL